VKSSFYVFRYARTDGHNRDTKKHKNYFLLNKMSFYTTFWYNVHHSCELKVLQLHNQPTVELSTPTGCSSGFVGPWQGDQSIVAIMNGNDYRSSKRIQKNMVLASDVVLLIKSDADPISKKGRDTITSISSMNTAMPSKWHLEFSKKRRNICRMLHTKSMGTYSNEENER
jgi:hypothetical protein